MVQHKPTPEEQLLKLIENPGGHGAAGSKGAPVGTRPGAATGKKVLPDLGKFQGFLSYLKRGFSKKAGPIRRMEFRFDIKLINRILLALVISSAVYLLIDFFLLKPVKGNFLSQVATAEKVYPSFQNSQNAEPAIFQTMKRRFKSAIPLPLPERLRRPLGLAKNLLNRPRRRVMCRSSIR